MKNEVPRNAINHIKSTSCVSFIALKMSSCLFYSYQCLIHFSLDEIIMIACFTYQQFLVIDSLKIKNCLEVKDSYMGHLYYIVTYLLQKIYDFINVFFSLPNNSVAKWVIAFINGSVGHVFEYHWRFFLSFI